MNERALRWLAWLVTVLSVAMAVAAIAISVASHSPVLSLTGYGLSTALMGGLFPLCGVVILTRQPRNVIGWLFCFIGFWQALEPFSGTYAIQALISNPGSLPLGTFMAWLSVWTWAPGAVVALTFLFLLFPDGTLPSPRWRPVAWLSAAALVALTVPLAIATWRSRGLEDLSNNDPPVHGFEQVAYAVSRVSTVAAIPVAFACVTSIWVRLRGTSGDEREQIKWFAYAAVIVVTGFVADGFITGGSPISALWVPIVPVATGIAIFKYRLYDIDAIISRTLVYGSLAVFITAVYVGIAVGIGAAIGGGGKPNLALSILATAIVATGFQPLRQRLQRLANRLVYGKRATPYEVLSQFSESVAGSYASDDVLPRMARILGEGTAAESAGVWLCSGGQLRRAAAFPADTAMPAAVQLNDGAKLSIPAADRAVVVRHQGEVLGALTVSKRHGESITPIEIKLMDDLAHQAGLVLKNVGLTSDLRARLEDLRASRQRLVAAQDDERRRLERDLHDGAQQHLVAMKVKLGLVEMLARRDPERAIAAVAELKQDADEALATLRDLARGIYPPLLADKGLPTALQAQARKATLPVTIEAGGIGRYAQDTEAALYFCILEALQNIQKYAHASCATVRLTQKGDQLAVEVTDDGRGFDVSTTARGNGLINMEDRLDALGGTLRIESSTGRGTTLRAALCAPEALPVKS